MQLSDHSLRQIDEAYLERLGDAALRALSAKLLVDLKEARERLNQSRRNSSLPPSREAPWEKTRPADATMEGDEPPEASVAAEGPPETATADGPTAEDEPAPAAATQPLTPQRAGQVKGAPGHGRPPQRVDAVEAHGPAECAGCGASLVGHIGRAYTGYSEVDWVREGPGWAVRIIQHRLEESLCAGGHVTRAEPVRIVEDDVAIGGFRLVGPGRVSLMVALSNETPWPEQGASSLWRWVFITGHTVLYYVSHRGQELVRNLLEGLVGVLMSDGWQAYRHGH